MPDQNASRAPKLLTADTLIQDGDVLRWDWDGSPRFYWVRIYPITTGRVGIRVQLEGDPTAWHDSSTEDGPLCINEAVLDCIGEIESMCSDEWDREQDAQQREDQRDFDYQRFDLQR